MSKRSAQEKIDKYKLKIKKIEEQEIECHQIQQIQETLEALQDEEIAGRSEVTAIKSQDGPSIPPDTEGQPAAPVLIGVSHNGEEATYTSVETVQEANLDPELLSALRFSRSAPKFGEDIHETLTSLWAPLLKSGLTKKGKRRLMREYLIPANCKLLKAPKLNVEISTAISDAVRERDKKLGHHQQQLGIGTAAINKAMHIILKSNNKVTAFKFLADGCRLLCDLHHRLTKDRVNLLNLDLDQDFLNLTQGSERDDTLYGNSFADKLNKNSNDIESRESLLTEINTNQEISTPQTQLPCNTDTWIILPRCYPWDNKYKDTSEDEE